MPLPKPYANVPANDIPHAPTNICDNGSASGSVNGFESTDVAVNLFEYAIEPIHEPLAEPNIVPTPDILGVNY